MFIRNIIKYYIEILNKRVLCERLAVYKTFPKICKTKTPKQKSTITEIKT